MMEAAAVDTMYFRFPFTLSWDMYDLHVIRSNYMSSISYAKNCMISNVMT